MHSSSAKTTPWWQTELLSITAEKGTKHKMKLKTHTFRVNEFGRLQLSKMTSRVPHLARSWEVITTMSYFSKHELYDADEHLDVLIVRLKRIEV